MKSTENRIVKKSDCCHLALEGEGGTQCRVRGKVHKDNLICTPSSVLRTSSPSRGKQTPNAFTLIELLVVVLIIGILAAVALPQYQKVVYKSYATDVIIIGTSLLKAQKLFYLSNGRYASSLNELDIEFAGAKTDEDDLENHQITSYQGVDNKWIIRQAHDHFWIVPSYSGKNPLPKDVGFNAYWKGNHKGSISCGSSTDAGLKVCQGVTGQREPAPGRSEYELVKLNY